MRLLFWTAVLVAIALWMPRSAWVFTALFGAAAIFSLGIWAAWRIGVGMVKAWRIGAATPANCTNGTIKKRG